MNDDPNIELVEWPSVDDAFPEEEGGPVARTGFSYQDEIAVSLLLDMLECPEIEKIHCETHDDILVVRGDDVEAQRIAEFVQVKAGEPDSLWSVASICRRKNHRPGTSMFETSLSRDQHKEEARFRMVTLRDVNSELKPLTYKPNAPGRHLDSAGCKALLVAIEQRCTGWKSKKGNGPDYWIANCSWDVRPKKSAVQDQNLLRLIQIGAREGRQLLWDQADLLLNDLRARAKAAGDAKWRSERSKKIITRSMLRSWWEKRTEDIIWGASSPSGGRLRDKMEEATLPTDVVELAVDLRRRYAKSSRTPRYMELERGEILQDLVKSKVLTLRSKLLAGELDLTGPGFHELCLKHLDAINAARELGAEDQSAFLMGCMYDIADRCMLRFVGPP